MQIRPVVARIVLDVRASSRNALLIRDSRQLANTLLLVRRRRIAKQRVRAKHTRRTARVEGSVLPHRRKRSQLGAVSSVSPTIVHSTKAVARAALVRANERRPLVLALLPYPHVLRVVTTATPLIDGKLLPRAQTRTVLTATSLGLQPRRTVQAAAHADSRAAAHAQRRVKCPPKL